jgi:von Willebrand factor type A domain
VWSAVTFVGLALVRLTVVPAEEPLAKHVRGLSPAARRKSADGGPSIYADPEGRARTSMFGVSGVGFKFVYVLDRSASMGGSGEEALKAVKAELVKSLKNLDTVHQFQIVFYNEKPVVFNPSGVSGRLAFANQANKDRAARFVDSITADGGTNHDEALKLAIRLRPDVIFLLTDGDDPKLSRSQLNQIRRMAFGITIDTIEFGPGPKPEGKSFLATLAEENNGKYTYVDLAKYLSGRSRRQRDR